MAIVTNTVSSKIATTATYAVGSFEIELDGNGLQNMVNFLNAQALLGFLPANSSETGEQGFIVSQRGHEVWATIELTAGGGAQVGAFHAKRFEIQHDATGITQFATYLNTLLKGVAGLYHTFCYATDKGVYLVPLVGADLSAASPHPAFQQFPTFAVSQFEVGENGLGIGQLADYLQARQTGNGSYTVELRSYNWVTLAYIIAIVAND